MFNVWRCLQELYASATEEVTGPLHSAHQWVNMTDVRVQLNATHTVSDGPTGAVFAGRA